MLYADLVLYGIKRVVAGLLLIAYLTGMMWEERVVDYVRKTFGYLFGATVEKQTPKSSYLASRLILIAETHASSLKTIVTFGTCILKSLHALFLDLVMFLYVPVQG